MKFYEIVIILNSNYQDKIEDLIKFYSDKILSENGEIFKFEKIGLRDLSYPIKKNNKAYYILINIKYYTNKIKELENSIKINEFIIRYIILKIKTPTIKKSKLSK